MKTAATALISFLLVALISACSSAAPGVSAQNVDNPLLLRSAPAVIDLRPAWQVGQSWEYEAIQTAESWTDWVQTMRLVRTRTFTAHVLEVNNGTPVMRYTLNSADAQWPGDSDWDDVFDRLAGLLVDVPIEVILDENYAVSSVRNMSEVRRRAQESAESFLEFAEQTVGEEGRSEMEAVLAGGFASDASLTGQQLLAGLVEMVPEMSLHLGPVGWEVTPGEESRIVDEVEVPGTGVVLDVVNTATILDSDPSDELVRVTASQFVDPQSDAFAELNARGDGEVVTEVLAALPTVKGWYTYDLSAETLVDGLAVEKSTDGPVHGRNTHFVRLLK